MIGTFRCIAGALLLCRGLTLAQVPDCGGGGGEDNCQAAAIARLPGVPTTAALAAARARQQQRHVTEIRDPRKDAIPATQPAPVPPDPPTEFQLFAADSTGVTLPIYGSDLFHGVPATFAPVERQPVTADYAIGPGDELLLRVWGQVNLNLELTVDPTGAIYIPQAGSVPVSGVAFRELQEVLRGQLSRVFRNFELNVTMGQLRSIQIFVVGQARRPGSYTVSSLSTLVNAIFACGGPSPQGSMRRVALKRDNTVISEFDLYKLILDGDKSADRKLSAGDVIYFPVTGPQVALAGSVRNAAIYELKGAQTVEEAIHMAGGLTPVAGRQMARIERIGLHSRGVDELTLDGPGLSTPLANGDVIRFPSVAPRFDREVTLRGNVANPGRFPWRPGMRLSDIIPDKESLTTRSYWEKHNQLGFTPAPFGSPGGEDRTDLKAAGPDINWSYAVIERRSSKDLSRQLTPFHLGKLVLEHDPGQDVELRPADVVTIFTQRDLRVPVSQQNRFVRLEGEFKAPGIYEAGAGETLGQLIARTGGFTKDAYLYGAELTRESVRRDQQERLDRYIRDLEREAAAAVSTPEKEPSTDLTKRIADRLRTLRASGRIALPEIAGDGVDPIGKLLAIPLEDGDRFLAPPTPVTVNVLGAVYNAGAMLHNGGLRMRDYLRLAGGCTRAADRNRVFVIRADGTVMSKQSFGRLGPDFEMRHLKPGDSIVAPEALPKTPFVRHLRDWTQTFSQFGLSAAAINVLR
jgi:protein involved in polysaccharide export with SLBB domain